MALLAIIISALMAFSEPEVLKIQSAIKGLPVGERIAYWAEQFIGTPYDKDPLGEYVSKKAIVSDERIDCMYMTFRVVELALSSTPKEAIDRALRLRFITAGRLSPDGIVLNYEDRYQYAEDMIFSRKWGIDITPSLGNTIEIEGSRGIERVSIIPKESLPYSIRSLKSGDIVYFIKSPKRRLVGEIVGHMGIIKSEEDIYLIHASGSKSSGGEVKKVRLSDYIKDMPFIGIMVTRFQEGLF